MQNNIANLGFENLPVLSSGKIIASHPSQMEVKHLKIRKTKSGLGMPPARTK